MRTAFLIIFLMLLCAFKTKAQSVISYEGQNMVIGNQVAILEDPTGKLDFQNIRSSDQFKQSELANPDLGLSRSTFWIKFTVHNASKDSRLIVDLENPTLTDCHFFYPENTSYKTIYLSNRWSISQRKYQHPDFLFDIILPRDSTATFYMKIKGTEQLVLPIILGNRLAIIRTKMDAQILWGIFIGIIAIMVAYNFFLFIFTRDRSYLWYVLYCLFYRTYPDHP